MVKQKLVLMKICAGNIVLCIVVSSSAASSSPQVLNEDDHLFLVYLLNYLFIMIQMTNCQMCRLWIIYYVDQDHIL